MESKQLLLCTRLWKNDQLYDQLRFMQLEKKLKLRWCSAITKPNTKPLHVKEYFIPLKHRQTWVPKQLDKVHFYGSHVHWSHNTEHVKVSRYFTNKQKTRFDYRKHLNKKILLNTFFWLYFHKKKNPFDYKNFLYTNIFWLNINLFSLNDKILTKQKYFFDWIKMV